MTYQISSLHLIKLMAISVVRLLNRIIYGANYESIDFFPYFDTW